MPAVSIVMSVYNGGKYLREAIDSMLHQTFTDFEFIILDDGSTDDTSSILDSYTDSRIIRIKNDGNIGLTASLNLGIALSKGKYVARMDADDISLENRLSKQVDFFNSHPRVGVLGTGFEEFDEEDRLVRTWRHPENHGVICWYLCFLAPFAHPSVMIRKDVLARVEGYDIKMTYAQDHDLWRRMNRTTRFHNLPDVLLRLRKHSGSISDTGARKQRNNGIISSHKMMEEILGRDVPIKLVNRLHTFDNTKPEYAHELAELLVILYRTYLRENPLTINDTLQIKRHVSNLLYNFSVPQPYKMGTFLLLACRLNPSLILRISTTPYRRTMRYVRKGLNYFIGQ